MWMIGRDGMGWREVLGLNRIGLDEKTARIFVLTRLSWTGRNIPFLLSWRRMSAFDDFFLSTNIFLSYFYSWLWSEDSIFSGTVRKGGRECSMFQSQLVNIRVRWSSSISFVLNHFSMMDVHLTEQFSFASTFFRAAVAVLLFRSWWLLSLAGRCAIDALMRAV